jgi:hypothetical protein
MGRLAADPGVPPDLRGAAYGFVWSLDAPPDEPGGGPYSGPGGGPDSGPGGGTGPADGPVRALRAAAAPDTIGDWLAGLFALAREEVLHGDGVLHLLDDLVTRMAENDFLIAVAALRQAFAYFPPRERETIADRLLARRGAGTSGRALLHGRIDPATVLRGRALELRVDALLVREGLQ